FSLAWRRRKDRKYAFPTPSEGNFGGAETISLPMDMSPYFRRTSRWTAILLILGLMALAMPESLSSSEDASDPPATACCLLDAARGLRSSRPTTQKQGGSVKA